LFAIKVVNKTVINN